MPSVALCCRRTNARGVFPPKQSSTGTSTSSSRQLIPRGSNGKDLHAAVDSKTDTVDPCFGGCKRMRLCTGGTLQYLLGRRTPWSWSIFCDRGTITSTRVPRSTSISPPHAAARRRPPPPKSECRSAGSRSRRRCHNLPLRRILLNLYLRDRPSWNSF